MQLPKMKTLLVISFTLFFQASSQADGNEKFRTPAKLYASAYSVKLSIKRKGFEYEVPVWVKPDQKESTLDRSLLKEMGWIYNDLRADEVMMSGEKINHLSFKDARSDWAGAPKYKKPCCYGVIGQDILKEFEVRFDPNIPIHLEWSAVVESEKNGALKSEDRKFFDQSLKELFSVKTSVRSFGGKKLDLAKVPYVLNVTKNQLVLETLK